MLQSSQLSENFENLSHNFVCLDLKLLIIKLKIRTEKETANSQIYSLDFTHNILWLYNIHCIPQGANNSKIQYLQYIDGMAIYCESITDYNFRSPVSSNQR